MKITNKKPHTVKILLTHDLIEKLKAEHSFRGQPIVSYGVIGKLIEIYEKRLLDVELKLKGK